MHSSFIIPHSSFIEVPHSSSKVRDAILENRLELRAVHVLVQVLCPRARCGPFCPTPGHRARAGPPQASGAAVGVEALVHGGVAGQVHILRGDLAVCRSAPVSALSGAHEAALAVADGHGVDVADARMPLSHGLLSEAMHGAYQHALVAADGIEGEGGAVGVGIEDAADRAPAPA